MVHADIWCLGRNQRTWRKPYRSDAHDDMHSYGHVKAMSFSQNVIHQSQHHDPRVFIDIPFIEISRDFFLLFATESRKLIFMIPCFHKGMAAIFQAPRINLVEILTRYYVFFVHDFFFSFPQNRNNFQRGWFNFLFLLHLSSFTSSPTGGFQVVFRNPVRVKFVRFFSKLLLDSASRRSSCLK